MDETSRIDFRKNGNLSSKNKETVANLIAHHHYLIKGSRVITLDKLTSTKIYSIFFL